MLYTLSAVVLLSLALLSETTAELGIEPQNLLQKVEAAYAQVQDYRVRVEATTYEKKGAVETKKFIYTFRKPNRIRLDFESPQPGLILIYPDPKGRVLVRPSSWIPFFKLRLAPDNYLLLDSSGQRVDQTDLGSLITHMGHSLTDQRRGPAVLSIENGLFRIQVLANNPFRPGTVALYRYFIEPTLLLPIKVEVSAPDGRLERKIIFESLSINPGVADGFFHLD